MQQHTRRSIKRSTFTTPIAVFQILLSGPAIVLGLPLMLGWQQDYLSSRLYLFGTLGQALMDLPAVVMLARTKVDWLGRK